MAKKGRILNLDYSCNRSKEEEEAGGEFIEGTID